MSTRTFTTSDFDFDLPPELIAQYPARERSASRLLDASGAAPVDRTFHDFPALLTERDLLVFNDTKVVKARLFGSKPTGGRLELLVERVLADGSVAAHMKAGKKPAPGTVLRMEGGFDVAVLGRWPNEHGDLFHLRFAGDPYQLMAEHGHMPLPPYIHHEATAEDEKRYQTVFARNPGAVASPTAALHFDSSVLAALDGRGVRRTAVTLHVGAGTFQPMKGENIAEHVMHHERYWIPADTLQAIAACHARGGRVVAVGTTTVRTLEAWARTGETQGDTDLFITPGFQFRVVDALSTNFHLPRSTLMMLVSAFAGHEKIMALYRHAVEARYRFFSYGDAMFLTRA
jgi:S-adenosylmethionine:tRNA ribosyltransferase-isomerase